MNFNKTNRMPWMLDEPKKSVIAYLLVAPRIWYQLCHNTYSPIGNHKHNNAINCKKFDTIFFWFEWKWIKLYLCNNLVFRFGFASQIKHQNDFYWIQLKFSQITQHWQYIDISVNFVFQSGTDYQLCIEHIAGLEKYKTYKRILQQVKRKTKLHYYRSRCKEFKNDTRKLWSLINTITGRTKKKGNYYRES